VQKLVQRRSFSFSAKESSRVFIRQLEERRAVVENNLMTGRQYLAAMAVDKPNAGKRGNNGEGELRHFLLMRTKGLIEIGIPAG